MTSSTGPPVGGGTLVRLRRAARDVAGLRLLVLHGSRATGAASRHSDWDFGYLGEDTIDPSRLYDTLSAALRTDTIDLVDLDRATALLRFRASRDGFAVHERSAGTFTRFRVSAAQFWCDAGPVIRAAQESVLAALP